MSKINIFYGKYHKTIYIYIYICFYGYVRIEAISKACILEDHKKKNPEGIYKTNTVFER